MALHPSLYKLHNLHEHINTIIDNANNYIISHKNTEDIQQMCIHVCVGVIENIVFIQGCF